VRVPRARAAVLAKGGGGGGGGKGGKGGGAAQASSAQSERICARSSDYSQWYLDVIAAGDLVDASPVRGCMVIKPAGMALWEGVRDVLDRRIKAKGVQSAYFPLLIPVSFLSKEAEHVEGFAKECAVVTHHRLRAVPGGTGVEPDPDARLEEPLIVRPTSETIIWHMFGKWITSYRDLPLKVNQWANVLRWELRTRPFLRSAEFLWQEGHTAHATAAEANALAAEVLDMYADVCESLLALPVVRGEKSASERFAGAEATYTIEGLMQNGWALQCGTSHFLGQNFAKAFDVRFQTSDSGLEHVWATSWGMTTRLIGALVMSHSDDAGLVLPPRIAPLQVVIVPFAAKEPADAAAVDAAVSELRGALEAEGVRVHVDARDHLRAGAKYFEWERKGVPLRVDIGPRDLTSGETKMSRRTDSAKLPLPLADMRAAAATINAELEAMQAALLDTARARIAAATFELSSYGEMAARLNSDEPSTSGFFLVPWADDAANEATIKEETKATLRCYPFAEQHRAEGKACFFSGRPATHMALFARAY